MIQSGKEGYFEEYKFITAEIIKRGELGFTILNITFVTVGASWGAAFSYSKWYFLALYPMIALLLALGYSSNAVVSSSLGHYMREVLEEEIYEFCWASYFHTILSTSLRIGKTLTSGIFVGSSLISLFLYFQQVNLKLSGGIREMDPYFVVGAVCTIGSVIVLIIMYKHQPRKIRADVRKIKARKKIRFAARNSTLPAE